MPPRAVRQTPTSVKKRAGDGVLDRISSYEADPNEGIKILLYGRSKTGKTTLWSDFPGKILVVVFSGGNKLGELRSVPKDRLKKIECVNIQESSEMKTIIDFQRENNAYQTLVVDHVSGMQDKVLSEILGLTELPAQMGWGVASQQQYGQCSLQCKEILRALLGLSCNVVLIAQEKDPKETTDDSELLIPTVGAAVMPSLAGWIYPAVDYICQTFKRQKTETKTTNLAMAGKTVVKTKEVKVEGCDYCLRTGPHEVYTTGFRVPKGSPLPDVIVDPTFAKLKEVIDGKWKA